jgi:hypothetical protein
MPVDEFQLIAPPGARPLGHQSYEALVEAAKSRLPLSDLRYSVIVSDEDLRRQVGFVAGLALPVAELVLLCIDGDVSREDGRTKLQDAVAEAGRADISVVHAQPGS